MTRAADEIYEQAEVASLEWVRDIEKKEGGIKKHVKALLDNKIQDMVLFAAGFRKGYSRGEWEIDRSNRSSNLLTNLNEVADAAIAEWFAEQDVTKLIPELTPETIQNLRDEFERQVTYFLRERIKGRAQARAEELVAEIVDTPLESLKLAKIRAEIQQLEEKRRTVERETT